MSRCFPFPPPGYEKKARTDDVDLLKKEKHREKKHKKEKKDRDKRESREKDSEKRESKEKSEKDRSDGKHREKKDKKEKHRDKKKDKEKDRDTVKDKRIPGKNQSHGAEKLANNEFKDNFVDKREIRQAGGYQAEKLSQNHRLAEEKQHSELVELGWRNKDEARGIGNQLVEKVTESEQKDKGMVRLVAKATNSLAEVKERNNEKRVDDRKEDWQAVKGAVWLGGNTMVQNPVVMVEKKAEGISTPFGSNVDRKIDGKEKTKEKQGDDRRGEKSKAKGREKRKQGKDKDKDKEKKKEVKQKEKSEYKNSEPNKEKRKEEKTMEKNESENAEPDKLKKINEGEHANSYSVLTSQLSKDSNKSSGADANIKKRKDLKPNGVLHANDIRPSKLLRASSSSHPVTENGRPVEPCQTSISYVSDRLVVANNVKVENKDSKINGIIEAPSFSVSLAKPPHRAVQADLVAEAPMRPPHPDSKYLALVYLIPRVEEAPDYDDQDWLFGCSDTQSKKPKVESSGVEEIPQVWSEALRIESADVHVLPYVIPY